MRYLIWFILLFNLTYAQDIEQKNELYVTAYIQSLHFAKNDQRNESYNEKHNAYGLEYIYDETYSLTYNHFVNSREKDVEVLGIGYLFHFNDEFGFQLITGYQKGYCFGSSPLDSVECRESISNEGTYVLPMLYFKYKYVKIDLFTNGEMVSFRYNLKVF